MTDLETPEVSILLLGDAEVGKSTFLSYVLDPPYPPRTPSPSPSFLPSQLIHISSISSQGSPSTHRRISKGSKSHDSKDPIILLKDGDQPFVFDITFFNRPYRFEFFDTSSPENWALLQPDVIVLCYDISSRLSLINAQRVVSSHFSA